MQKHGHRYVHLSLHTHVWMPGYLCVCVLTYIYTSSCLCICTCAFVYDKMYAHVFVRFTYILIRRCMCICTCMSICMHTCERVCVLCVKACTSGFANLYMRGCAREYAYHSRYVNNIKVFLCVQVSVLMYVFTYANVFGTVHRAPESRAETTSRAPACSSTAASPTPTLPPHSAAEG